MSLKPEDFKVGLLVTPDLSVEHVDYICNKGSHSVTSQLGGQVGEVLEVLTDTDSVWVVWWPRVNMNWNWSCQYLKKI